MNYYQRDYGIHHTTCSITLQQRNRTKKVKIRDGVPKGSVLRPDLSDIIQTKIIIVMPPSMISSINISGIFIDESCVRCVHSAINLGVVLDYDLSFHYQILKVVKSCFYVIRSLSRIKSFLSYEQLRTAVCACIYFKLYYCYSLYYGVNALLLNKLQSVQNSAVRLLRRKMDSATKAPMHTSGNAVSYVLRTNYL